MDMCTLYIHLGLPCVGSIIPVQTFYFALFANRVSICTCYKIIHEKMSTKESKKETQNWRAG
jgi:hypothetical protein